MPTAGTPRPEFVDDCAVALCVEQLVVAGKHEECPNSGAIQGERDIVPPAPLNSKSIMMLSFARAVISALA